MHRTAASCVMVMLLTATLLWGGCLSCEQYFMMPGAQAGHCCAPSGECKRTPNHGSPAKDCSFQSFVLEQKAASPDHAAILISSVLATTVYDSAFFLPQFTLSYLSASRGHRSPPNFFSLHPVFRV